MSLVRAIFVAPSGQTFWARDFSGIEALLVGYFAQSPRYMRLCKLDIHSFFTAYTLVEVDHKMLPGDLPSESWSDTELGAYLGTIKYQYKKQRTANKPLVHGGNYLMGPFEAQEVLLKETHQVVPLKTIKRLQAFYWELFPEIPRWHQQVTGLSGPGDTEQQGAAQKGYLRTPFGNVHRFYDVLRYDKGPNGWEQKYSSDAKRAVAFLPQSSARFILTRAAQRLPVEVRDTLRLFIHDELLGLCAIGNVDRCLQASQVEMERPIPELGGLVVGTEAKQGPVWGMMR